MPNAIQERIDSLDQEHFDSAARWVADALADRGCGVVRLAPGDMTEYRIGIIAPAVEWAYGEERRGKYYYVTLCASFGAGYEWTGQDVHGQYAAEKWTNAGTAKATREWTGAIVARFLTAVAECFREATA